MRILVIGASGYIGRHLIPKLREAGHEVWGLYQTVPPFGGTAYDRWGAELTDLPGFVFAGLPVPDTIIHLAGRVEINLQPNPLGPEHPPVPGPCDIGALYRDNVLATANVLEYCLKAGVKHLIFASTQAVYGIPRYDAWDELTAWPLEYYAASKLAAENLLRVPRPDGPKIDILRLPGVYGGDRKSGLVYRMCKDALTKQEITLNIPYPLPMNVMHIEDAIEAFIATGKWQPPNDNWAVVGTWDISGDESCSLNILANEIASLVPKCLAWHEVKQHPEMQFRDNIAGYMLKWKPKPRKERLTQLLEEIRRELNLSEEYGRPL